MVKRWRHIPTPWLWALSTVGAVLVVLFVLWLGPWLFTRYPSLGLNAEQELRAKSDVRTTLVQAVAGLAVASGAIVTYRTFLHTRVEQDRAYKLDQSQQVTDTYTKAVEQLGYAQAPVRLGALYSLVSLAQDSPPRRQTVVDVLCAYLRMPFSLPVGDDMPTGRTAAVDEEMRWANRERPKRQTKAAQELQVRQTVQRLLAEHLRRPPNTTGEEAQRRKASADTDFWPGINIDLTGAVLNQLNWDRASVVLADFSDAAFSDFASFSESAFSDHAHFDGAQFLTYAMFNASSFYGSASFSHAIFGSLAIFQEATFFGDADFSAVTFSANPTFDGVRVLNLDAEMRLEAWPDGWAVHRDPDNTTQGTLVPSQQQ